MQWGQNRGPDRVEAMRMKTPPFPADAADPAAVDAAPRDRSRLKPGCVLMLPTENGHRQCCQPIVRNGSLLPGAFVTPPASHGQKRDGLDAALTPPCPASLATVGHSGGSYLSYGERNPWRDHRGDPDRHRGIPVEFIVGWRAGTCFRRRHFTGTGSTDCDPWSARTGGSPRSKGRCRPSRTRTSAFINCSDQRRLRQLRADTW